MRHFVAVVVLIALVTVAVGSLLGPEKILPVLASEEGALVDRLFSVYAFVIAFFFALIVVIMVYSAIVFRRKKGDTQPGADFHGNSVLEVAWTVVPLAIVLYFAGVGAAYLKESMEPELDELLVEVNAAQWSWRFDYPDYGISSPELVLPVNQQALFQMSSQDVIHSFWVPEFRLKQDVVPGMTTTLRLKPSLTGNFTVRCAELCGLNHAYMLAPVKVLEQEEFDAWVAEETGATALSAEERGEELAELNGCIGCHSWDGTALVGPTWLGMFGSEVTMADGSTVIVDEAYLRMSIMDPNADVVEGFPPNLMPQTFGENLTDAEIEDLIAFIRSLGN